MILVDDVRRTCFCFATENRMNVPPFIAFTPDGNVSQQVAASNQLQVKAQQFVPVSIEEKKIIEDVKTRAKDEAKRTQRDKVLLLVFMAALALGIILFLLWLFVWRKPATAGDITFTAFAFAAPSGTYIVGSTSQVLVPSLNVYSLSTLTSAPSIPVTFVYEYSSSTNQTDIASVTVTDSNNNSYDLNVVGPSTNKNVTLSSAKVGTSATFTINAVNISKVSSNTPLPLTVTYQGVVPNSNTIGLSGPSSTFTGKAHKPRNKAYFDPRLGLVVSATSVPLTFNGGPNALSGFYTVTDGSTTSNSNLTDTELTSGSFTLDTSQFVNQTVSVTLTLNYYMTNGSVQSVTSSSVQVSKGSSPSPTVVTAVGPVGFNAASAAAQSSWQTSLNVAPSDALYLYFAANGSFTSGTVTTSNTTAATIPAPGSAGISTNGSGNYWIPFTAPSTTGTYSYTVNLLPTVGGTPVSSTAVTLTVQTTPPPPPTRVSQITAVGFSKTPNSKSWQSNLTVAEGTPLYLYFSVSPTKGTFAQGSYSTTPSSTTTGSIPASSDKAAEGLKTDNNGIYWLEITAPPPVSSPNTYYTFTVSLPPSAGAAVVSQTSKAQLVTTSSYADVSGFGLFLFNGVSPLASSTLEDSSSKTLCSIENTALNFGKILSEGLFLSSQDAITSGYTSPNSTWTLKNSCLLLCIVQPTVQITSNAYFFVPPTPPPASTTQWIYTVAQFRPIPSATGSSPTPASYVANFFDPGLSQIASEVQSGKTVFNPTISFYNLYSSSVDETKGTGLTLCTVKLGATIVVSPLVSSVDYLSCGSYTYSSNPSTKGITIGFVNSSVGSPTSADLIPFTTETSFSSTTYTDVFLPTNTTSQENNMQIFFRTNAGSPLVSYAVGTSITPQT